MQNETSNNDVLFDRLVDGELTERERRRFLGSLDKEPDGWRRCAIAFLESQSWREELGQVAHDLPSAKKEPKSALSLRQQSRSPHSADGAKWLALAASLLLAFGLGWMQRESAVPVAGGSLTGSNQVAKISPQGPTDASKGARPGDAITFYVGDDTGHKHAVRVPLVDADALDNQYGVKFRTGVPDQMRDRLNEHGYQVQSKRKYAQLWLENGQPMIVPVEDTKIVPDVY